jgi:hypothetical protein
MYGSRLNLPLAVISWLFCAVSLQAQDKTVTLIVGKNSTTASYAVETNQIVTFSAFDFNTTNAPAVVVSGYNGLTLNFGGALGDDPNGEVYTSITNISLTAYTTNTAMLTFSVETPAAQSLIPANAVLIPSDATGPVQIVLESSSDLVNWVSSLPGTYGSTYTNRFFRVRAIAQ